jgi:hypothetical protein
MEGDKPTYVPALVVKGGKIALMGKQQPLVRVTHKLAQPVTTLAMRDGFYPLYEPHKKALR